MRQLSKGVSKQAAAYTEITKNCPRSASARRTWRCQRLMKLTDLPFDLDYLRAIIGELVRFLPAHTCICRHPLPTLRDNTKIP